MIKSSLNARNTALVLIGYQNDYFSSDGILRSVVEESLRINDTIKNTVNLLDQINSSEMLVVAMPIIFSDEYIELDQDPVGILNTIKELGAFRKSQKGSQTIDELKQFGDRINYLQGKHGLNAFIDTNLEQFLIDSGIQNIVLAGAVTSICIDSTGRFASDKGFKVYILSDITSARTQVEQEFYCQQIFPLYAKVVTLEELLKKLGISGE